MMIDDDDDNDEVIKDHTSGRYCSFVTCIDACFQESSCKMKS